MLRADNWVASLSWTRKGQPESYRMGHSNPVRWQYDNNGRLSVVTDPVGHTVRREYDERDRLTHLYNENGEMYRFVQGANDRLHEEQGWTVLSPATNMTVVTGLSAGHGRLARRTH